MAGLPKKKRAKQKQRTRRSQPDYQFTETPSMAKKGKRKVVRHLITPDSPVRERDGVQFLPEKNKVAKGA